MVKVTNDFYIDADKYGYTVLKKNVSKETNKEYFITWCYGGTIESCISSIMRTLQREKAKESLSIREYLEECKKINQEMKEILQGIEEVEKCQLINISI